MSLDKIREDIDLVDKNLLTSLIQRYNLVKSALETKKKNDIPVEDPKREQQVLEKVKQIAKEENIDEEYLLDIMNYIIQKGKEVIPRP